MLRDHTTPDQVDERARELIDVLRREAPGILDQSPIDRYVEDLERVHPYAAFTSMSEGVERAAESIRQAGGATALAVYHKLVLLRLIGQFDRRVKTAPVSLPDEVMAEYRKLFERMLDEMDGNAADFYDLSNELLIPA